MNQIIRERESVRGLSNPWQELNIDEAEPELTQKLPPEKQDSVPLRSYVQSVGELKKSWEQQRKQNLYKAGETLTNFQGSAPMKLNKDLKSNLLDAIEEGEVDFVKRILSIAYRCGGKEGLTEVLMSEEQENGLLAFHIACEKNNGEILELLFNALNLALNSEDSSFEYSKVFLKKLLSSEISILNFIVGYYYTSEPVCPEVEKANPGLEDYTFKNLEYLRSQLKSVFGQGAYLQILQKAINEKDNPLQYSIVCSYGTSLEMITTGWDFIFEDLEKSPEIMMDFFSKENKLFRNTVRYEIFGAEITADYLLNKLDYLASQGSDLIKEKISKFIFSKYSNYENLFEYGAVKWTSSQFHQLAKIAKKLKLNANDLVNYLGNIFKYLVSRNNSAKKVDIIIELMQDLEVENEEIKELMLGGGSENYSPFIEAAAYYDNIKSFITHLRNFGVNNEEFKNLIQNEVAKGDNSFKSYEKEEKRLKLVSYLFDSLESFGIEGEDLKKFILKSGVLEHNNVPEVFAYIVDKFESLKPSKDEAKEFLDMKISRSIDRSILDYTFSQGDIMVLLNLLDRAEIDKLGLFSIFKPRFLKTAHNLSSWGDEEILDKCLNNVEILDVPKQELVSFILEKNEHNEDLVDYFSKEPEGLKLIVNKLRSYGVAENIIKKRIVGDDLGANSLFAKCFNPENSQQEFYYSCNESIKTLLFILEYMQDKGLKLSSNQIGSIDHFFRFNDLIERNGEERAKDLKQWTSLTKICLSLEKEPRTSIRKAGESATSRNLGRELNEKKMLNAFNSAFESNSQINFRTLKPLIDKLESKARTLQGKGKKLDLIPSLTDEKEFKAFVHIVVMAHEIAKVLDNRHNLNEPSDLFYDMLLSFKKPKQSWQNLLGKINGYSSEDIDDLKDSLDFIYDYLVLPSLVFQKNKESQDIASVDSSQKKYRGKIAKKIFAGKSLQYILGASRALHDNMGRLSKMIREIVTEGEWAPIFEDCEIKDSPLSGCKIRCMVSASEKEKEGEVLSNCLTHNYLKECLRAENHLIAFKDEFKKSQSHLRVAVIDESQSRKVDNDLIKIADSGYYLKILEHRGSNNSSDINDKAKQMYEVFKEKVENGEIKIETNSNNLGETAASKKKQAVSELMNIFGFEEVTRENLINKLKKFSIYLFEQPTIVLDRTLEKLNKLKDDFANNQLKKYNPTYLKSIKNQLNKKLLKLIEYLRPSSTPKDILETLESIRSEVNKIEPRLLGLKDLQALIYKFSAFNSILEASKNRFERQAIFFKVHNNPMTLSYMKTFFRKEFLEKTFEAFKDPSLNAYKFKEDMVKELEILRQEDRRPAHMGDSQLIKAKTLNEFIDFS